MPLVVLAGHPAAGKSGVAARLAELLRAAGQPVALIDEPSLHLTRDAAYESSGAEKATRGTLKSAVERAVSKKTAVILDSLNAIKGFRYELWCVARAAGTRYCLLHVATPAEAARAWNGARPAEWDRYSPAVFDDLARRFERPDSRNRWDAPLFTVLPGSDEEPAVLAAVVAAMTSGGGQQQQPQPQQPQQQAQDQQQQDQPQQQQQQQQAQAQGQARLLHQGGSAFELRPTAATSTAALAGTNVLHDIDRAAQAVVAAVLEAQQLGGGAGSEAGGLVDLGAAGSLQLSRHASLAELRRLKREFLRLATKVTFSRLQDPAAAQRLFVDHLRAALGTTG